MNSSRLETPKKEPEKRKNIREIYLQALKHSKGFKKTNTKKKGISNLANDERNGFSGSNYLEKEYNLVQRILSDTKELKSIKIKSDSVNKNDPTSQSLRQIAPKYRSQEEYYQEVLDLKRTIKLLQNNEIITKAKFEYYENEMAKKEQEILDLLDVKKSDIVSTVDSTKFDSNSSIYSLKQKAYKLEFALKRKDNELNKLKNELKTTNLKELKTQNERLRIELANALTHDKRIIEVFEKKGVPTELNGSSYYDSETHKTLSEISLNKKEMLKHNIAKQLQGNIFDDSNDFISKFRNHSKKLVLKGTLKEKLEQLDQRETELLNEIDILNEELESLRKTGNVVHKAKDNLSDDLDNDRKGSSREEKETEKINNIKTLQSIMRGHLHRVNNLSKDNFDKSVVRRSPSPTLQRRKSPRDFSPPGHSPPRRKNSHEPHNRHHQHNHNHEDEENNEYNHRHRDDWKRPSSGRRRNYDENDEYDDKEKLIDEKKQEVPQVDSSCCSCSNSKSKKES